MNTAPLIGLETEYGIHVHGPEPTDPFAASRLLLARCEEAGAASREWSLMLSNGARFYIDHAHPEYSTPETASAREAASADKAGERLVERCRRRVQDGGDLPAGRRLALYKNNSDGKGNSYGCHENYLIPDALFDELIRRRAPRLLSVLAPFLATRVILCGAGKVGAENGADDAGYQLSQRADFFETLAALQTTYRRPLVNTRDEPHAPGWARLHVIAGDANLAEYSTFLKVGCTALVLRLMLDGAALPDLTLSDPLAAVAVVSRDLTFHAPLALRGGGSVTALQAQRLYLEQARRYDDAADVVAAWEDALGRLEEDWRLAAGRLDWAVKRRVLERYLEGRGGDWETARLWAPVFRRAAGLGSDEDAFTALRRFLPDAADELDAYAAAQGLDRADHDRQREIHYGLRRLDLEYHDTAETGLFARLERGGAVERLLGDDEVERRVDEPPETTRAYLRGRCLRAFAGAVFAADWEAVWLAGPGGAWRVRLDDPRAGTRDEVGALFDGGLSPPELLAALAARGLAVRDPVR